MSKSIREAKSRSLVLVALLFNSWSFVTTAIGIAGAAPGLNKITYGFGAWGASLALQFSIVALYSFVAVSISMRRSLTLTIPICLFAVALSIISGIVASSTNMKIFNFAYLQEAHEEDVLEEVLAPVAALVNKTSALDRAFTDYSSFATSRAEREEDHGDSCEGKRLDKICGSICNWRKRQSLQANGLSIIARDLQQQGAELGIFAAGNLNAEKVIEIHRRVRRLVGSPNVQKLANGATILKDEVENGFDMGSGLRICKDSDASSRLANILDKVNQWPSITLVPPKIKVQTIGDSAARNIDAALRGLFSLSTFKLKHIIKVFSHPDLQAFRGWWLFSLAVELGCGMFVVLNACARLPFRGVPSNLLSDSQRGILGPDGIGYFEKLLKIHLRHTIRFNKCVYFFVNEDGDPNIRADARAYANRVGMQKTGPDGVDFSMMGEETEWLAERLRRETGGTTFEIFNFRKASYYERCLHNALEIGNRSPIFNNFEVVK